MGASSSSTFLPTSGPLNAKDYKSRLSSSEGTQSLYFPSCGYTIRYAYVTQRGYYPDAPDKANQDSLCSHPQFGGDMEQALFGVFDGHGEYGTQCAQFARDKVRQGSHAWTVGCHIPRPCTMLPFPFPCPKPCSAHYLLMASHALFAGAREPLE